MISLIRSDVFRMLDTQRGSLLKLGTESFLWPNLTQDDHLELIDYLSSGKEIELSHGLYRYYHVMNELELSDGCHLELQATVGHWQAYLIADGLPTAEVPRVAIRPTDEIISGRHKLWPSYDLAYSIPSSVSLHLDGKLSI